MGLADVLNGMLAGPRGQRQAQPSSGSGGGGMSPLMMALLGLLAYKAFKGRGGQAAPPGTQRPVTPGGANQPIPSSANAPGGLGDILCGLFGGPSGRTPAGTKPGGNLSDMLPGGLGGLLGGAAAGSVLSGGLDNLIKGFQQSGHGHVAQSWVGSGPNQEIAAKDLEKALGSDTLDTLSSESGMDRNDLLAGLSQYLPELVDQLTPHGRIPTEEEASRMV
jgi:uncharacterized protein YidB (DUF937 family)